MTRRHVRTGARGAVTNPALAAFLSAALVVGSPGVAQQEKAGAGAADPAAKTGAAATPAASPKAPAADDTAILPFVGDDTFLVGRLEMAAVDPAAVEKFMYEVASGFQKMMEMEAGEPGEPEDPDAEESLKAELAEPMEQMREGLAAFAEAGGRRVYFLMDPQDFEGDGAPLTLTPLGAGADAAKLADLLEEFADAEGATSAKVGEVLVAGAADRVEAMTQRAEAAAGDKAARERPDLAKAFAAAGDVPLRLAFVPGEATRAAIEANADDIPAELGDDVKLISRGIRWIAIGVAQKPAITAHVTIQAADGDTATRLAAACENFLATARKLQKPGSDVLKKLTAVKPVAKGDRVTFSSDVAALQVGLLGGFGPRAEEIDAGADDAADGVRDKPPAAADPKPDKDGL
jgi:hypothetical protein